MSIGMQSGEIKSFRFEIQNLGMADEEEDGRTKSTSFFSDYSNEKPIFNKVFYQREDDTPSLDVRESTFSKQT
jgi:hypothetical protein